MTGRVVLTTVGTSTLDGKKLERLRLGSAYQDISRDLRRVPPEALNQWIDGDISFPKVEQFIADCVERTLDYDVAIEVKNPSVDRVNIFSAELSSLHLMYASNEFQLDPAQDALVFLLSESPQGVLAGIINQLLLSHSDGQYLQGKSMQPRLQIVSGLQVDNFKQFFSQGLRTLVDCIRQATDGRPQGGVILNITGGFKSLVAYSTLIAFAFDIPVVFVFEELTDIIKIQLPSSGLSPAQREQLIGGYRKAVTESFGLEPDAFDTTP